MAAGECRDYPDTKRLALRLANLDIGPNVPKFPSEPKEVNLQAAEGMAGIVHHGDPNTIVIESIEDELKDEYQQDKTERDGTLALNIPLPPIRPAIQEYV